MNKTSVFNSHIRKFAYYDLEEIYNEFQTTSNGISINNVENMKKKYGANSISGKKEDTLWYRLRRAFINPFNIILFALAIISFFTDVILSYNSKSNPTTVIIIVAMILISGIIRFFQEVRAKNASDKLNKLINSKVTVKREGILVYIPANELVVGDIVLFSAGDPIPADLRLIETKDLFVSQAAITGESNLSEKKSRKYSYTQEISLTQYENLVFMGTSIISGKGEGIVIAVGEKTLYGNFLDWNKEFKSKFHRGANSIAWVMIKFMLLLVPIVFFVSGITKGNWLQALVFSLSVAVGLTPEMLPMVITTCLAKGSLSMSKKQTIIKDINAIQGFGSMDILCMDKTGTITNETIILEYYMDILGNESSDVLDFAYLNSLYHSGFVNPIDRAILKYEEMPGKEKYFENLKGNHIKIDEIPFDYNRKVVSTLISDGDNNRTLIIKGDIKEVVGKCKYIQHEGNVIPMKEEEKNSVSYIVDEMLDDGMKVIAIAKRELDKEEKITSEEENNMVLLGYLVFFDAPKKSAAKSVEALRKLNVKCKILTGDHKEIATSICKRVGISTEGILTGDKLNELSDSELIISVENIDVFAELTPSQKVRVVRALKENGHTVGFLGDGINDIPGISEADVGISVDTAADATKEVSDVVLLEKDLNVLEQGILEGRKTFDNMLKYIKITASSNFGNIFSIVCASAFLPFLPMTAIQLLILNLLYDVLCIAIPWDNVDIEECSLPREWSGKNLGRFMLYFGPISSIFDIVTFVFLYFILCPSLCQGLLFTQIANPELQIKYIALFQTGWFLESMWTQILIIHMLRSKKTAFIESKPSKSLVITTIVGIILVTSLVFSNIAGILEMIILPYWYFIFLLVVVILYMTLTTIFKKLYIKRYKHLI